jgi:hypothetical protein
MEPRRPLQFDLGNPFVKADVSFHLDLLPAKHLAKPTPGRLLEIVEVLVTDDGDKSTPGNALEIDERDRAGIKLADPVRRNRPGRRSSSTLLLIASSNSGARWISSITARSRLRIIPAGSSRADRRVSSSSKVR